MAACCATALADVTLPVSGSSSSGTSCVLGVLGLWCVDFSLGRGLVTLLEVLKERVFWAPLGAGPEDVRERRVAGIFGQCVRLCLRWLLSW